MGETDTGCETVLQVLEEALHGVGRAGKKQVVIDLDMRVERSIGHIGLSVLGIVERQSVDVGLLRPYAGFLAFDERIHLLAYADEVLALRIREELEEFGDTDAHAVVARTGMRIFGLVLAVLGRTELVLVRLLLLSLNGVLLVDGCEHQVHGFADEGLAACRRCGDATEERERLLLPVQILESHTRG